MLKLTTLSSSSKGNCHILECESSSIMIDCGIRAEFITKHINISKLDGVFITHRHSDHSKGAKQLSLYTICKYYMNEESFENIDLWGNDKKEIVSHNKLIETKDFKILCFDVYHDVQNTNFLIQHKESGIKILYITDTSDVSNLKFKDIDYFIIEGNFSLAWSLEEKKYQRTNSDYGHLPIEETINFLNKNINVNTKKIFITHISHSFKNIKEFEDMVKAQFPEVEVYAIQNQTICPQSFLLKEDLEINFD